MAWMMCISHHANCITRPRLQCTSNPFPIGEQQFKKAAPDLCILPNGTFGSVHKVTLFLWYPLGSRSEQGCPLSMPRAKCSFRYDKLQNPLEQIGKVSWHYAYMSFLVLLKTENSQLWFKVFHQQWGTCQVECPKDLWLAQKCSTSIYFLQGILLRSMLWRFFYAGDKNLWITFRQKEVTMTMLMMESLIADLREWLGDNWLMCNDSKTGALVINGPRQQPIDFPPLSIGDAQVLTSDS